MVFAIDGYEANVTDRVGVGQYAYEIINHLSMLLESRNNPPIVRIYLPASALPDMPKARERWQYRVMKPKKFWTILALPFALTIDKPKADVVFSPTHYAPRFIGTPRVVSIMDLSFLRYPALFRPRDLYKLVNWTAYSVHHAARIFTISEFSKRAIIEAYRIPEKRVTVTHPGFRMPKKKPGTLDEVVRKYSLRRDYILSVGTLQPRKNYVRLIRAYAKLMDTNKDLAGLDLVIVGKRGWLYDEILRAPGESHVEDHVKFLEYIPDSDLAVLYGHAACFILPSLYEGFGFPVLEAMAYGCPVVVSRTSSLPEIAGEAGVYVDPESIESIAQGLETALNERGKESGRERIEKGRKQAEKFSWESTAQKTLAILEEVGSRKGK